MRFKNYIDTLFNSEYNKEIVGKLQRGEITEEQFLEYIQNMNLDFFANTTEVE